MKPNINDVLQGCGKYQSMREDTSTSSRVSVRPERPYGLLGTGSPGRPPRLLHSSGALARQGERLRFCCTCFQRWGPGSIAIKNILKKKKEKQKVGGGGRNSDLDQHEAEKNNSNKKRFIW